MKIMRRMLLHLSLNARQRAREELEFAETPELAALELNKYDARGAILVLCELDTINRSILINRMISWTNGNSSKAPINLKRISLILQEMNVRHSYQGVGTALKMLD